MNKILLWTSVLLFMLKVNVCAQEISVRYLEVVNLEGKWKLMIGDDKTWAAPGYNDSSWEKVDVPANWESQGFYGYDGFAWYRKQFTLNEAFKDASLMLFLGYVDDVDEAYINGFEIGHKGAFPPHFWTAYNSERRYNIPREYLNFGGVNTIAVRIYDAQLDGGIIGGDIGIYQRKQELAFDVNLDGFWKFAKGDNMDRKNPGFDDSDWSEISVPGIWEDQMAGNYDGFGWYRKKFNVPASMAGKRYVLMMGKIDDIDEVYINGKLVGETGEIRDNPFRIRFNGEYAQQRYYYLDEDALIPGAENTISVRVYDGGGEGGIYEGPVGLVELRRFVSYWRKH